MVLTFRTYRVPVTLKYLSFLLGNSVLRHFCISRALDNSWNRKKRKKKMSICSLNLRDKARCLATTTKSLQSCPTLCYPTDSSPPGSPIPGILQARTLEWVAISFSNAWKWKVKVKSLSRVRLLATRGLQPTRLLCPWDFPGKSTGVGCHCLLQLTFSVTA